MEKWMNGKPLRALDGQTPLRKTPPHLGIEPRTHLLRRTGPLTWVDQLESFAGALRVTVELQPQVVGGGDERQPQHGRAGEGAQDVRCVVFAVIDLEAKGKKKSRNSLDPNDRRSNQWCSSWDRGFPLVEVLLTFRMSPWARWKVLAEMLMPFPACTWRIQHFFFFNGTVGFFYLHKKWKSDFRLCLLPECCRCTRGCCRSSLGSLAREGSPRCWWPRSRIQLRKQTQMDVRLVAEVLTGIYTQKQCWNKTFVWALHWVLTHTSQCVVSQPRRG